jgi:glycosyltransferase involved in cell wall biosynthesis
LHVIHVGFFCDPHDRDGETLLRDWPTLRDVAVAVARSGVEISVVQAAARDETITRDGVVFHFVADKQGALSRIPRFSASVSVPRRLIARVRSMEPDVVHVHGLHYPRALRRLGRVLGDTPIVVQDHATRAPRGWRARIWRALCRRLSGVIFTSRDLAQPFVDAGVFSQDLPIFEVLESSVHFTPGDQQSARRDTGLDGDPCFLWTGHLNENKDPLTALAAFAEAVPQLPDARLWCCFGTAPLLKQVEEYIADHPGLADRVTLLGQRPHSEMEQLFRAADFFVQTSHRESTGYSLIEALACGTPALVTDIPASRKITANGTVSSLTPVGDAHALATAMVAWAQRDRLACRRAARDWFEEALSFERMGGELRAAYESVVRAT